MQENGPSSRQRPAVVAVIVVIVVGAVAALGYYTFKSEARSGYPPGGNCVAP